MKFLCCICDVWSSILLLVFFLLIVEEAYGVWLLLWMRSFEERRVTSYTFVNYSLSQKPTMLVIGFCDVFPRMTRPRQRRIRARAVPCSHGKRVPSDDRCGVFTALEHGVVSRDRRCVVATNRRTDGQTDTTTHRSGEATGA
mgnify:CR=1 FL=1